MNRDMIRQQLTGRGPFVIRTSDSKEITAPLSDFVMVGRHNLVIEDAQGLLDILDPFHVVSIRPGRRGKGAGSAV